MSYKLLKEFRQKEHALADKIFDVCFGDPEFKWATNGKKKGFSFFKKKEAPKTAGFYIQDFIKDSKKEMQDLIKTFKALHKDTGCHLMNWREFDKYLPEVRKSFEQRPEFSTYCTLGSYTNSFDDFVFDVLISLDKDSWNPDYVPLGVAYSPQVCTKEYDDDSMVYLVLMDLDTATITIKRIFCFLMQDCLSREEVVTSRRKKKA